MGGRYLELMMKAFLFYGKVFFVRNLREALMFDCLVKKEINTYNHE